MTELLPPKKDVALALLERSNVDVYLDPRAKGVVVPPQFRKEPRLILKIGLNMPVPIPDLHLDDESMCCTLSFNRTPFYCVVVWSAVFAMVGEDGRGMVWPDDVPRELAVKVGGAAGPSPVPPSDEAPPAAAPVATSPSGKAGARGRGKSSRIVGATSQGAASTSGEDAPSARGGKKKKSKKEEPRRPVLVAVPSPPPSAPSVSSEREPEAQPRAAAADRSRENARPQPPAAPAASVPQAPQAPQPASAPGRGTPASSRPKRELPPYLRVVK